MRGEAGNHGQQQRIGIGFQAELFLNGGFVDFFTLHCARVVVFDQMLISLRIPHRFVYTVENTAETAFRLAGLQQTMEAAGGGFLGDFCRVSGADGGDVVGIKQTGFQERNLAVKFQTFYLVHLLRQIQLRQMFGLEHALIGNIVNSKHAAGGALPVFQISGGQAGLPIMGVQHFGFTPLFIQAAGQRGGDPA